MEKRNFKKKKKEESNVPVPNIALRKVFMLNKLQRNSESCKMHYFQIKNKNIRKNNSTGFFLAPTPNNYRYLFQG